MPCVYVSVYIRTVYICVYLHTYVSAYSLLTCSQFQLIFALHNYIHTYILIEFRLVCMHTALELEFIVTPRHSCQWWT